MVFGLLHELFDTFRHPDLIQLLFRLPFVTQVLGQNVTVTTVDITKRDQIVAIYLRGKARQAIPIVDLPII